MLTMDASTGGVAAVEVKKSVSISDASSPNESFAFVINGVIVVSQIISIACTFQLFKVASFPSCGEKTSSSLITESSHNNGC